MKNETTQAPSVSAVTPAGEPVNAQPALRIKIGKRAPEKPEMLPCAMMVY